MQDTRNHLTLVQPEFRERTGKLSPIQWMIWCDLMHEAESIGMNRRAAHLQLILDSSPLQGGWGATTLVQAMSGERPPATGSAAAFVGIGALPQQPNGHLAAPPPPEKRPGILGFFRRR